MKTPKRISKWWAEQTTKDRKQILIDSKFNRTDIKEYDLVERTLDELSDEGWSTARIIEECKIYMKIEKEFAPLISAFIGLANSLGPEWDTLTIGNTEYRRK